MVQILSRQHRALCCVATRKQLSHINAFLQPTLGFLGECRSFATGADVLTVEIEHVDVDSLDAIAQDRVIIEPQPGTLRTIQVPPFL